MNNNNACSIFKKLITLVRIEIGLTSLSCFINVFGQLVRIGITALAQQARILPALLELQGAMAERGFQHLGHFYHLATDG